MLADITGHCDTHPFEGASGLCIHCGGEFCESCMVRPYGNSKTICVKCALITAGVRRSRTKPITRRERKRRQREQRDILETLAAAPVRNWVSSDEVSPALARAAESRISA